MKNNIRIQFVKIPVSETLVAYIEKKVSILMHHYPFIKSGMVFIKKEPKNISRECICEIELHISGKQLFASSSTHYFEGAIKETLRQLSHQLDRSKSKLIAHHL